MRYHSWLLQQLPSLDDLTRERLSVHRWPTTPTISILTPVYDTPPEMLRHMIQSVRCQSYEHWELCLVNDGSSAPWMATALSRLAAGDPRIRILHRPHNGGIVAASNDALAAATGDFVATLDHDDELDPRALYAFARAIVAQPDVDLLYSDLDIIDGRGVRHEPMFMPDWSPELLLAIPYVVHLTAFRRELVLRLGGFRAEYEGSQDYDLALRVTRATDRIVHIPQVLYHWRTWARSAAGNPEAKPYAYSAGIRAINDHLRHHAFEGRREDGPALGVHAVRFAIRGEPLVSIVFPWPWPQGEPRADDGANGAGGNGDGHAGRADEVERMRRTVTTLAQHTAYAACEYLIVGPSDAAPSMIAALAASSVKTVREQARFVPYDGPEDAALAANEGAAHARGEHLLFIGHELEPMADDWLTAMLEFAQQPGIGAVGPRIYGADGATVWHAGIILPRAMPHRVRHDDRMSRNFSAASGACLMTSRTSFETAGGFRAREAVGCSDVDYCLRLRDHHERIVITAHARLRHCQTPSPEERATDRATFQQLWASRMEHDPYYNPNFRQDGPWFQVGQD